MTGVKLIFTFDGSLNCALTVADWPGAKLFAFGTVRNGLPLNVPIAFASVTPLGNEVNRIWKGPLRVVVLMFVRVAAQPEVAETGSGHRRDRRCGIGYFIIGQGQQAIHFLDTEAGETQIEVQDL